MFDEKSLIDSTKDGLFETLLGSIDRQFRDANESVLTDFQNDPERFGRELLGETYTDDIIRMMVSVRDNTVTVAISANATGKTHGAARVAVWFYKCFPNSQIYTAAAPPESNLRRLLWGEIGTIAEQHPKLFEHDNVNVLNIQRSAQSFVSGVTIPLSGSESQREAKFSGKHAPYLLFVIDEADAVPEEVFRGIESCMSGGHARMLVMFNPRHESGAVYRMIRDGKANVVRLSALNHPNVITGQDEIPGAVSRETVVRRINEWCRPLAAGEKPGRGDFKLPAFLEGCTAQSQSGTEFPPLKPGYYRINEPAFSYMVLGQYPELGSDQLISKAWIQAARDRFDAYVRENGETPNSLTGCFMGLDVGEFGTDATVACFRHGGFVEMPVAWDGVDIAETADRAVAEYRIRPVMQANIDATGIGAGVAPQMQRQGCCAVPVKVGSSPTQRTDQGDFHLLRDQLWWSVREWLRTDPGSMLPPDELLVEELSIPTYSVEKGEIRIMKKATMRELLKRSPDRADALCLTFMPGGAFAGHFI